MLVAAAKPLSYNPTTEMRDWAVLKGWLDSFIWDWSGKRLSATPSEDGACRWSHAAIIDPALGG